VINPRGILQELIGGIKTSVVLAGGSSIFQRRLAFLELNLEFAATKDLVFFFQNNQRIDAFREMNDGGIPGAHQSPLGTEMGVQGEDSGAVGIGTHKQLVDQGVVIREGAGESQTLSGHALDLLFLVFVVLVFVVVVRVVDVHGPLGAIETVWTERKGSGWS